MLQTVLLVVHVIIAISLITFILLQQGRGATTGAAFGSGASSTVFGSRGSASFLSRTTSVLAILFFANCLLLAFLGSQRTAPTSLLHHLSEESAPAPASTDAPPVPPAAAGGSAPSTAPAANSGAADVPNIPPAQTSP